MPDFLVLASLLLCQVPVQTSPAPDSDALKALSAIYDQNKTAFSDCVIVFEFTDGYANALDEAAAGKLTDAHSTGGTFAIRGRQIACTCVFSDESMHATTQQIAGGRIVNRLNSFRFVTNGKLTITDRIVAIEDGKHQRGTLIDSEKAGVFRLLQMPLSLGVPDEHREDLSRVFGMILDRTPGMKVDAVTEGVEVDGVRTIRVQISNPTGKRIIWIDPARAAIPIRTHDELSDGSTYDLHYGDIRLVGNHGWFPFESTTYSGKRVKRLRVKSVVHENVPDAMFRLEFPTPVATVNLASNLSYGPRKVWDLSNLPSSKSSDATPLKSVPTNDPELPAQREARPLYLPVLSSVISIVGILGFLWWKRRARQSAEHRS